MPSEKISAWERERQKLRKTAIKSVEALLRHMGDAAAWTFDLGDKLQVTVAVRKDEDLEPSQYPLNQSIRNRDRYRKKAKLLREQGKRDEALKAETQATRWALEAQTAEEAEPAASPPSKPARRTPSRRTRAKR